MASVAASTAAASCLGKSELLGNQLSLRSASSAPTSVSTTPSNNKIVSLFGKKKAAPPPPSKTKAKPAAATAVDDELAKWYGPDRRIFLPDGLLDRSEIPEYLTGEVPGE